MFGISCDVTVKACEIRNTKAGEQRVKDHLRLLVIDVHFDSTVSVGRSNGQCDQLSVVAVLMNFCGCLL